MPVEIRELVIRAYVEDSPQGESKGSVQAVGFNREEIVADCLEQVSQLLKERAER